MANHASISVLYHGHLPAAKDLAEQLAAKYDGERRWSLIPADRAHDYEEDLDHAGLVIAIGGDGTILRSVHQAARRGLAVLGVNMGRVGFMSEVEAEAATEQLGWYLDGHARVEQRMMIQAQVLDTGEPPLHALNDVVVGRGREIRIVDLRVVIDGVYLATYRADGVVVATATGSTGYSLALGGPVMDPSSDSFLLKPIAAHMSLQGGAVLPREAVLHVTLESEFDAVVSVDGFQETALAEGQTVEIRASSYVARFLRRNPPPAFYGSLTRRLGMRQGSMPR